MHYYIMSFSYRHTNFLITKNILERPIYQEKLLNLIK